MKQFRKEQEQADNHAASSTQMSRRKMIAGFGLAGMAITSAGFLGRSVIQADRATVHEAVYGLQETQSCTASIAALRDINGSVCQTIHVLGYYAANDGGGGLFYWDGSSTAPDNGGTVIQPTGTATGRWIRNVSF